MSPVVPRFSSILNHSRVMDAPASCARMLVASLWSPGDSAVGALLAERWEWLLRAKATGVRSALLHTAGWRIHWHEGSDAAVDAEWQRVRADPRLRNPRLLHRSHGAGLLCEPVQVASLHDASSPTDVARRLHVLQREQDHGWDADPVQMWQALGAPCQLGQVGAAGAVGRREVLAVAGESHEATELARLLAQQRGQPLAYQRLAGSDFTRADVGAAYLDLPLSATATARVQCLPRRSLAGGVLMLGLRHVEHLVLLIGRDGGRVRALLADAALLLQSLPMPPRVTLLCRCPLLRTHAQAALAQLPPEVLSFVDADGSARAGLVLVEESLRASAAQAEDRERRVAA
jgi:hypothetical protein